MIYHQLSSYIFYVLPINLNMWMIPTPIKSLWDTFGLYVIEWVNFQERQNHQMPIHNDCLKSVKYWNRNIGWFCPCIFQSIMCISQAVEMGVKVTLLKQPRLDDINLLEPNIFDSLSIFVLVLET